MCPRTEAAQKFLEQRIRMISEDHVTLTTGDENDAENSAAHHRNKLHLKVNLITALKYIIKL